MTTEFTNNINAATPFLPEGQHTTNEEDHGRSDEGGRIVADEIDAGDDVEAEEVVPNPFTREDAIQFLSFDGTSLTIPPNTFTAIADKAFGNSEFNLLETVIIPDSITSIGAESFYY